MNIPGGARIWLVAGYTDMRKGFDGLAALVQVQLKQNPFSGQVFIFRGRRGDRVKVLWWESLFYKRLEQGRFIWPSANAGKIHLTYAQLSMLLEGIDWRAPKRTSRPKIIA